MSTLTISCPLPCDATMGRPGGDLVLYPVSLFEDETEVEVDDDPWSVTQVSLIKANDRSTVFRAKIERPPREGRTDIGALDVVLKMDPTGKRTDEFFQEAISYATTAEKLQGTVVPKFYGSFHAQIQSTVIFCTVTQYCGEPMNTSVAEVADPFWCVTHWSLIKLSFLASYFSVVNSSKWSKPYTLTVPLMVISTNATFSTTTAIPF
jgi:hypothetical protein